MGTGVEPSSPGRTLNILFFFLKIYSSVGGEALDPVKVLCPSIGECQEAGVGGLVSRGSGEEVFRGETWKGDSI